MPFWVFFPVRQRLSLLIIIMSSERQPETNRICNICNIAGTFKGKLSSILQLSRAPTPSSIEKVASSDNPTRWVTKILFSDIPLKLSRTSVAGIDHVPITASATDSVAYTLSPIPAPVSGLIPVPKQLDSAGDRGLEASPTVSDHAVLKIVVANLAHSIVYP